MTGIEQARRDEQEMLATLRGEHPWIPGSRFIAYPELAEYLALAVEAFFGEGGPVCDDYDAEPAE